MVLLQRVSCVYGVELGRGYLQKKSNACNILHLQHLPSSDQMMLSCPREVFEHI